VNVDRRGGAAGSVVGSVALVPLVRLRLWPGNPRWIAPERLEDLKRALIDEPEMLWGRPLLALSDGTVFCGNQRLRAASELGWESIPTLFVNLDRQRAKLWALRDNNAWGEWDEPALAEILAELAAGGVDLALTGFEHKDIDRLLAGFTSELDPDELPPLPIGPPDSKPGEIYELGPHRLLCGDATDPEQLAALMAGQRAELLLTDPPYGVSYSGKTRRALTIRNDDQAGLAALLRTGFAAADAVLNPSARFYVFAPAGPAGTEFRLALGEVGWQLHQSLVWAKDAIVLGHSDYHYSHEDVLYGWTPGPGRPGRGRHRGTRWFGDNAQASVLYADRPKRSAEHPTAKPVGLLEVLLRNSSRRGDLVLDSFAGSGSTLIAAERLGRRCFAVEIDAAYCDVVRRRYEGLVSRG
jgi:DNA modification methylase